MEHDNGIFEYRRSFDEMRWWFRPRGGPVFYSKCAQLNCKCVNAANYIVIDGRGWGGGLDSGAKISALSGINNYILADQELRQWVRF